MNGDEKVIPNVSFITGSFNAENPISNRKSSDMHKDNSPPKTGIKFGFQNKDVLKKCNLVCFADDDKISSPVLQKKPNLPNMSDLIEKEMKLVSDKKVAEEKLIQRQDKFIRDSQHKHRSAERKRSYSPKKGLSRGSQKRKRSPNDKINDTLKLNLSSSRIEKRTCKSFPEKRSRWPEPSQSSTKSYHNSFVKPETPIQNKRKSYSRNENNSYFPRDNDLKVKRKKYYINSDFERESSPKKNKKLEIKKHENKKDKTEYQFQITNEVKIKDSTKKLINKNSSENNEVSDKIEKTVHDKDKKKYLVSDNYVLENKLSLNYIKTEEIIDKNIYSNSIESREIKNKVKDINLSKNYNKTQMEVQDKLFNAAETKKVQVVMDIDNCLKTKNIIVGSKKTSSKNKLASHTLLVSPLSKILKSTKTKDEKNKKMNSNHYSSENKLSSNDTKQNKKTAIDEIFHSQIIESDEIKCEIKDNDEANIDLDNIDIFKVKKEEYNLLILDENKEHTLVDMDRNMNLSCYVGKESTLELCRLNETKNKLLIVNDNATIDTKLICENPLSLENGERIETMNNKQMCLGDSCLAEKIYSSKMVSDMDEILITEDKEMNVDENVIFLDDGLDLIEAIIETRDENIIPDVISILDKECSEINIFQDSKTNDNQIDVEDRNVNTEGERLDENVMLDKISCEIDLYYKNNEQVFQDKQIKDENIDIEFKESVSTEEELNEVNVIPIEISFSELEMYYKNNEPDFQDNKSNDRKIEEENTDTEYNGSDKESVSTEEELTDESVIPDEVSCEIDLYNKSNEQAVKDEQTGEENTNTEYKEQSDKENVSTYEKLLETSEQSTNSTSNRQKNEFSQQKNDVEKLKSLRNFPLVSEIYDFDKELENLKIGMTVSISKEYREMLFQKLIYINTKKSYAKFQRILYFALKYKYPGISFCQKQREFKFDMWRLPDAVIVRINKIVEKQYSKREKRLAFIEDLNDI